MEKTKEIESKATKKSTSYSLKAMNNHLKTIVDDDLTTEDERKIFSEILKKWTEKFIKRDFGL